MRAILLSILLLFAPQALLADELADLQAENFLLKSEVQLAKSNKLYMIIDLPGRAVLFKAGGVVINRLAFKDCLVEGPYPAPALRTLSAKKAEKQPKRQEVKIVTEAEMEAAPIPAPGTDTLVALEIDDMPETYELVLDDGLTLAVRSEVTGFKAKAERLWKESVESARRLYNSLMRRFGREVEVENRMIISLSGPDARQFYWSFDEGMTCLIRVSESPS